MSLSLEELCRIERDRMMFIAQAKYARRMLSSWFMSKAQREYWKQELKMAEDYLEVDQILWPEHYGRGVLA